MRLQQEQKENWELPVNYFCKTLTASQVTQALVCASSGGWKSVSSFGKHLSKNHAANYQT